MTGRTQGMMRTMWELAVHELRAQRRETFLGMLWMIAWPLLQAGGFLIAFSLIRGGSPGSDLLTTYIGVLVWSTAAMMLTGSLGFFSRNAEMIKHMVFPFHLIMVNDVNVKFVFFALQLMVAVCVFVVQRDGADALAVLGSIGLFVCALYLLLVALSWVGSLLGVLLPDLNLALPSVLMLLLALSPVFHRDPAAMPAAIALLNSLNPLSLMVVSLYECLGLYGEVKPPYLMAAIALGMFALTRLGVRRLYQELAKIV